MPKSRLLFRIAFGSALSLHVLALLGCGSEGEGGGAWTMPEQVAPTEGIRSPALVTGGDGAALALWRERVGRDESPGFADCIAASRRDGGGRWGAVTRVDDCRSLLLEPTFAAIGDSGTAMVVWAEVGRGTTEETGEIWSRRCVPDGEWEAPEPVIVGLPPRIGFSPRVAFGSGEVAFAVWSEQGAGGDNGQIVVARYAPEAGWAEPSRASVEVRQPGLTPLIEDVEVDETGTVVVVWRELRSMSVIRYDPEDGWGPSDTLDELVPALPLVEIDEQGTAWLFWPPVERTGNLASVVRHTESGWGPLTRFSAGTGLGGALAADDRGGAVVVFTSGFRLDQEIIAYWSRYLGGEEWAPLETMPLGPGTGSPRLGLGVAGDGTYLSLYYRDPVNDVPNSSQASVWASELADEGLWSEPLRLSENGPFLIAIEDTYGPPAVEPTDERGALGLWVQEIVDRRSRSPWSSHYQ